MDTRASLSPFRAFPVLIALLFNAMAPVASIAIPDAAPVPLAAPDRAVAADDPAHVAFTLQGCRNPSVNLETSGFICADGDYTTGNLGKTWNELDLVPHRLTTSVGNQDSATSTYTIGITADYCEEAVADGICNLAQGDRPGYDVMTAPVVNSAKSAAGCSISTSPLPNQPATVVNPGIGGTDLSLGRLLTITQNKGTTCVFDWVERLALGSHLFPGSSLHTNRTNQQFSTRGIGAADVSIPVNEILPQELDKTMSAVRGQAFAWDVSKAATPTSLDFANTCLTTSGALNAEVEITITWTRSGPNAAGDTTITTQIFATNPAHRSVTVTVTDKIYEGVEQSVLLDTASAPPTDVPAGTADFLLLTHDFTYSGSATAFNDVATATYTDTDLGIPVPGQTTATASAATTVAAGDPSHASVVVSDSESISGEGLSFSVATPSVGAFTGYTAGSETTGPVNWSATVTDSGSVTFTKTVLVDEPRVTAGSLSDTATITGDGGAALDSANASVAITTDAQVSLTISKTIPDILTGSESETFTFDVTGPNGYASVQTLTFTAGDTSKSLELTGLAPGSYTVHERPLAGWNVQTDKVVDLTLPTCSGTASFTNSFGAATAQARKDTQPDGSEAGWKFFLNGPGASNIEVTTTDGAFVVFPMNLQEGSYSITEQLQDGWNQLSSSSECSFTVDYPRDAGRVFSCTFVNAAIGVDIDKTNEFDGGFVVRGQQIDYTIKVTVTNGPADNAVITDTLPDGLTYQAGSASPSSGFTLGADGDGNQVLTWTLASLPSGDSVFTYIASVDDDASGLLVNLACVDTHDSDEVCDDSNVEVTPPGVDIVKENNATGPASRGGTVSYDLTVTVVNGPAHGVVVTDTLPDGLTYKTATADPSTGFSVSSDGQQLTWDVGTLPTGTYTFKYDALVDDDAPIAEPLENVGCVAASDDDEDGLICDESEITVKESSLTIVKSNSFEGESVLRGTVVDYEITVTVTDGPVHNAVITDVLPDGLTYAAGTANPSTGFSASADGQMLTWTAPSLSNGAHTFSYQATVDEGAAGTLTNLACVDVDETDELLCDQSTVVVRVPTLVIDKTASTEIITIDGSTATPSTVTWTLSYTLTNGPVTNAVITDPLPTGFTFVSASDGGTFDAAARTITWNLGTLTGSGSVTFVTSVDVETISRTAPTVNVAVIASDQTPEDEGQDSVNVEVEPPPLAGTPTPKPSVPNTAAGIGPNGTPVTVPIELLVAFFLGSLGALAFANVRAASRRRR